ncbi:hypothetical protein ARMGADRAFT_1035555 [Armillaria gallica]|uniref:Uncharacterized protein n=1 Tax=Armillaria gallica TaxID=47427 RepID=A0A2H3CTH6_ARMGA|nr:hypothetical protein ARMGADRAFT_1035555 [Armillaria gallica]
MTHLKSKKAAMQEKKTAGESSVRDRERDGDTSLLHAEEEESAPTVGTTSKRKKTTASSKAKGKAMLAFEVQQSNDHERLWDGHVIEKDDKHKHDAYEGTQQRKHWYNHLTTLGATSRCIPSKEHYDTATAPRGRRHTDPPLKANIEGQYNINQHGIAGGYDTDTSAADIRSKGMHQSDELVRVKEETTMNGLTFEEQCAALWEQMRASGESKLKVPMWLCPDIRIRGIRIRRMRIWLQQLAISADALLKYAVASVFEVEESEYAARFMIGSYPGPRVFKVGEFEFTVRFALGGHPVPQEVIGDFVNFLLNFTLFFRPSFRRLLIIDGPG